MSRLRPTPNRRGRPVKPEPAPQPARVVLTCPHCQTRNPVPLRDALFDPRPLTCITCRRPFT